MKILLYICLIFAYSQVGLSHYRYPFYGLSDDAGTTPRIDQIFIGRCSDYQASHTMEHEVDCHELWMTFSSVFANLDPCKVQTAGYDKFIEKSSVPIPQDGSVFWSGTYDFTHSYVKTVGNLYTLEDVLPGYLVNSLTWCGQEKSPGINYETCSDPQGCNKNNTYDFWAKMSTWFAKSASGSVQVILNAGRDPAFASDSFFAKFELPNLPHDKVNKIEIIVVHGIDGKDNPKCGSGSIKELQSLIEQYNFAWTCADNPGLIIIFTFRFNFYLTYQKE
ncbi:uncharacterized protein TRIADDRAFT_19184 [Trichoplax adhaerens]|uniref:Uncharacterized protein n=1 Tax=Trichoplax adhaerens TaxID=10228 RepID=B3RIY1_TRIAD|nr:hypothetical protein TRIADDRAFT_19184 [Trichoplax adhaerens]EDV29268.1 hypothetical protein TRIADDRAFT_19184 [Trichoplax adhaerens]|eukprot:XP_002108470.1 hypothetical protein TRIADDRAFT_19184 [Trichoplax adhaerens]